MGGVLNLSLGSSMTTEECLEIVKKLDDISQNSFYTINVFDLVERKYLGDFELLYYADDHYTLINTSTTHTGWLARYEYTFYQSGKYARRRTILLDAEDILSRLDTIEQKLNEITESE